MTNETKIQAKLLEFQTSIEAIKKDGTNPHFNKRYATLTNVLREVKPILNALKIVVTQPIIGETVCTVLTDTESGESITSNISIPPGLTAQQVGSAISYFRRYTICSLLCLEIEDDDANAATPAPSAPAPSGKPWEKNPEDDAKPWLNDNTEQMTGAITFIQEGGTIEQIKKKYKVSKVIAEKLNSYIKKS